MGETRVYFLMASEIVSEFFCHGWALDDYVDAPWKRGAEEWKDKRIMCTAEKHGFDGRIFLKKLRDERSDEICCFGRLCFSAFDRVHESGTGLLCDRKLSEMRELACIRTRVHGGRCGENADMMFWIFSNRFGCRSDHAKDAAMRIFFRKKRLLYRS